MKAVWSLWTKPLLQTSNNGLWSFNHYLYSWIISVMTINRFFNRTELYTDDFGKLILVDILKIPFDKVYLNLNELEDLNINWWAAGKIQTYSLQKEPFIHFDSDVYLWDRLPERIMSANICAQSPEFFNSNNRDSYYKLKEIEENIKNGNGWLPGYWKNYTSGRVNFEASCCGIFGGNDLKLIRTYSKNALNIICLKRNKDIWNTWGNIALGNVLVEQFFLTLTVAAKGKTNIEYLFNEYENPFSETTENKYYTHLISTAKSDIMVQKLIERFIFLNCLEYVPRTRNAIQVIENNLIKYSTQHA